MGHFHGVPPPYGSAGHSARLGTIVPAKVRPLTSNVGLRKKFLECRSIAAYPCVISSDWPRTAVDRLVPADKGLKTPGPLFRGAQRDLGSLSCEQPADERGSS